MPIESRRRASAIPYLLALALGGSLVARVGSNGSPAQESSPAPGPCEGYLLRASLSRDSLQAQVSKCISSDRVDGAALIRRYYADDSTPFRVLAGRAHIEDLIATVPDPIESRRDESFDLDLDAIRRALETRGYLLDRFWLPWQADLQPGREGPPSTHRRTRPGIILFRKEVQRRNGVAGDSVIRDSLALVYLVGEVATTGLHREAFLAAVSDRDSVVTRPDSLRIVGPTFSGSATSLRIVLDRVLARDRSGSPGTRRRGPERAVIVSGSATSPTIRGILSVPPFMDFRVTVHSVAALKAAQDSLLQVLHVPQEQVAFIHEGGTGYGAALRGPEDEGKTRSDTAASACRGTGCRDDEGPLDVAFPIGVSSLRAAYEKLPRDLLQTTPVPRPALPLTWRDPNSAAEGIPALSGLTPAILDLLLDEIAHTLLTRHIRVAVVAGTDVQDKLFLIRELSRRVPGLRYIALESDIFLLRSEYRRDVMGTFVISTYPLVPRDSWSRCAPATLNPFATDAAEGTYNAVLYLLGRGHRMVDYTLPASSDTSCAADRPGDSRPGVWVSVIGDGEFLPIVLQTAPAVDSEYPDSVYMVKATDHPDAGRIEEHHGRSFIAIALILVAILASTVWRVSWDNWRDLKELVPGSPSGAGPAAPGRDAAPQDDPSPREARRGDPGSWSDTVRSGTRAFLTPITRESRENAAGRMVYRSAGLLAFSLALMPLALAEGLAFDKGFVGYWTAGVGLALPVLLSSCFIVFALCRGEWLAFVRRRTWVAFAVVGLGVVALCGGLLLSLEAAADASTEPFTAALRSWLWGHPGAVVVPALIGGLAVIWFLTRKGTALPRYGLRLIILLVTLLSVVFTLSYGWSFRRISTSPWRRDLYLYRALHLDIGFSPLMPILVIGFIAVVWAWWHYTRFPRPTEPGSEQQSLLTQALDEAIAGGKPEGERPDQPPEQGSGPAPNPDEARVWRELCREHARIRQTLKELAPGRYAGYVVVATLGILVLALVLPMQSTVEHIALESAGRPRGWWAFDCLLTTGVAISFATVIWADYRLLLLWARVRSLLQAVVRCPVVTALGRVPHMIARVTQFSLVKNQYRDASREWQRMRWRHLAILSRRIGAPANRGPYPADLLDAVRVLHSGGDTPSAESLRRVLKVLEGWWEVEPTSIEVADVIKGVAKEDAASEASRSQSVSGRIRRSFPSPWRTWMRGAEEYVASEIVDYIQGVLVDMRRLSLALLALVLLAVLLQASYPTPPGRAYGLGLLCLLAATVGTLVTTVVNANRDELLSRIMKTQPGAITWDRTLLLNLLLVAGIPLLSYLGSTIPEIREFLFGWVSPILKGLLHG